MDAKYMFSKITLLAPFLYTAAPIHHITQHGYVTSIGFKLGGGIAHKAHPATCSLLYMGVSIFFTSFP